MTITKAELQSQIEKVREELKRSKDFVNVNGYNCTTAVFTIVHQYRLELKRHLNILMINLGELIDEEEKVNEKDIVRMFLQSNRGVPQSPEHIAKVQALYESM